jgi:uncharacterized membrane protein YccC
VNRPRPGASFSPAALRYGARMAGAVLLAFATSALLHLPEGFWAVMSALIVVRPDTGSTLGAGWDRVRGALVGTALGLAATALRHVDGAADVAPLALVTLLAFAAGLTPSLRSAPISALIVATSSGMPGHSAGQVALLRALEIGIGVAAALLVSLLDLGSRATLRFRAAAAGQLHAQADALVADPAAPDREAAEAERRTALRQLALLADSADREARLLAGKRRRPELERHRRSARLLARLASDTALFARLRATGTDAAPGSDAVEQGAAASLRAVAEALQEGRPIAPASLSLAAIDCPGGDDRRVALRLLADDLNALIRLEGLQPASAT